MQKKRRKEKKYVKNNKNKGNKGNIALAPLHVARKVLRMGSLTGQCWPGAGAYKCYI